MCLKPKNMRGLVSVTDGHLFPHYAHIIQFMLS